jgi:hypothetical protein
MHVTEVLSFATRLISQRDAEGADKPEVNSLMEDLHLKHEKLNRKKASLELSVKQA